MFGNLLGESFSLNSSVKVIPQEVTVRQSARWMAVYFLCDEYSQEVKTLQEIVFNVFEGNPTFEEASIFASKLTRDSVNCIENGQDIPHYDRNLFECGGDDKMLRKKQKEHHTMIENIVVVLIEQKTKLL